MIILGAGIYAQSGYTTSQRNFYYFTATGKMCAGSNLGLYSAKQVFSHS